MGRGTGPPCQVDLLSLSQQILQMLAHLSVVALIELTQRALSMLANRRITIIVVIVLRFFARVRLARSLQALENLIVPSESFAGGHDRRVVILVLNSLETAKLLIRPIELAATESHRAFIEIIRFRHDLSALRHFIRESDVRAHLSRASKPSA